MYLLSKSFVTLKETQIVLIMICFSKDLYKSVQYPIRHSIIQISAFINDHSNKSYGGRVVRPEAKRRILGSNPSSHLLLGGKTSRSNSTKCVKLPILTGFPWEQQPKLSHSEPCA